LTTLGLHRVVFVKFEARLPAALSLQKSVGFLSEQLDFSSDKWMVLLYNEMPSLLQNTCFSLGKLLNYI
jgi:hypothetical protein